MDETITKILIGISNLGTWILEDFWNAIIFVGMAALIGITFNDIKKL